MSAERDFKRSGPWLILTMLLAGLAGGTAWGIRGQYGHESGAAIAGILVGFTLVVLHGRHLTALASARGVALFALGISIGGSMTYGQTVGLTHDRELIGNVEAYRWGMLGLAVKGGIWIGLGGSFFGMALSGKRYRSIELFLLMTALVGAYFLGVFLLNTPFDPANKKLPWIYFSDHWCWEADVDRPRRECWGGLACALCVLLTYLAIYKRDLLGFALGCWGVLGGALGFPIGQSVQACNAWHGDWVATLPSHEFTQYFNWWNVMETTFGFVMGAIVGLGCWIHRDMIGKSTVDDEADVVGLHPFVEVVLVVIHVRLLVAWNFQSLGIVDFMDDHSLLMIVVPLLAVLSGKYWPFLVSLPITMIPIAGKTVRQLYFREEDMPWIEATDWFEKLFGSATGQTNWDLYAVVPILLAALVGLGFSLASRDKKRVAKWFRPVGLLVAVWLYFYLNNAFFHSPWPWKDWTGRTANGLFFLVSSIVLSLAAVYESVRLMVVSDELG